MYLRVHATVLVMLSRLHLRHGFRCHGRQVIHLSKPRSFQKANFRTVSLNSHDIPSTKRRPWVGPAGLLAVATTGVVAYQTSKPFKHTVLAVVRCSRVGVAAVLGAIDYKITFAKTYSSEDERLQSYSKCHSRTSDRVLRALLANGGIFIKLGQHLGSVFVLPREWTDAMRPLQDRCEPTPYEDVEAMFISDMGVHVEDLFDEFDPKPIGVASLAQVHVALHLESGRQVAVKLQHPHLAEFSDIDMDMVEVTLGWVKYWFPEFEFTWLGEEMRENLPKELNFVHEAANAARTIRDFQDVRTSLYIPEVLLARKRVLVMEYIKGARVDDLEYLAEANIDRNKVALELSRIFSQMVHINGWFHADPHPGNLLIRLAPITSKSPYNFEIVLLDHGQYFDLDPKLRVDYSRLWISLISPSSKKVNEERRKYAEAVGNIGPDLYPVFEAALTGRVALEGTWEGEEDESSSGSTWKRASGLMDAAPQSEEEKDAIRRAVQTREGLLQSVFDVLRRVPRRILMILKLNDLTRSLDHALMTTHSNVRIFMISAKYCTYAVWRDDQRRLIDAMRDKGLLSFHLLGEYFRCWWRYEKAYTSLVFLESLMDIQAYLVISRAWVYGLFTRGLTGAHLAASGLA